MIKILVRAKPGAKREEVLEVKRETAREAVSETPGLFTPSPFRRAAAAATMRRFTVSVKEPAVGGKANRAIERALAEHFDVAPSRVRIVAGHVARDKVVEVV